MAEETKALVGDLLALLAHDLRNPLSALHSNVGFLEATLGPKEPDATEALADIVASCSSLKHIIDNLELLGLVVQAERPKFERFAVSLWDAASEALQRLDAVAKSYGAELTLRGERQGSPRVSVQRDMFVRALGNLLFNSVQCAGSHGKVDVSLATSGGRGIVRVTDGGTALSPALRDTAFSAAGQLTCKADPKGRYSRGLGLYAAGVAAEFAGAEVRSADGADGRNVFELSGPLC